MHFSSPSRSGSGIRVVLKGAGLDGPAFSPFPRLAPQVTRRLASAVTATYRLPRPCRLVFWVYNWRTSQVDVDHPECQEVLVSNEACLQFVRG